MTDLIDLLANGSRADTMLRFGPDQEAVAGDAVWHRAEERARWIAARLPAGAAVGTFLTLTPDTVPVIVGTWLAGVDLVSLPLPGRAPDLSAYFASISAIVRRLGISLILSADGVELPLATPQPVRFAAFSAASAGGPPFTRSRVGDLVQFTSGSTGVPRGVRMPLSALAVNVEAIIRHVALDEGVRCCSWLPLSHDMGLIGALFTSWAAAGKAAKTEISLSTPQAFLRDPLSWLRDCSRQQADYTLVPSFALDLVAKQLGAEADSLDLRRMRRLVIGSEPISAASLERFSQAAEPTGLSDVALCPSYGMAEVGVGVSGASPDEEWRATCVDSAALEQNRWVPTESSSGHRFVSLGRPLDGIHVEVAEADMTPSIGQPGAPIGYLTIRAASLLTEYVTVDGVQHVGDRLRTSDLGYVAASGEVFVTGRSEELLVVAGRNLYASDIERACQQVPAVRPGNCAAVPGKTGGYAVIAEPATAWTGADDALRSLRVALVSMIGLGPSEIVFVPRGTLSKTSSGKIRRGEIARRYHSDDYEIVGRREFIWRG